MAPRKLKFLVHTLEGTGHINAVVGYCQALAALGHECIFAVNESLVSTTEKYGFRAIPLSQNIDEKPGDFKYSDNPAKDMAAVIKAMGIFENKNSLAKLSSFRENEREAKFMENIKNLLIKFNPQLERIVEQELPIDAFILDHFLFPPAFGRRDIPWIMIGSAGPLTIYNTDQLPPPCSGFPSNDQTGWKEFFGVYEDGSKFYDKFQAELDGHFGYENDGHYRREGYFLRSPFLNVHQVPAELDYRDIYDPPKNIVAVDGFARQEATKLEGLPEEFQDAHKNGEKLIYLSMGSMGSFDIELMKKLAGILSKIPGVKTIVSKGPRGDEYELPANCWGRNSVAQQVVVELVDLVITHGGNNSVCETFTAGKPMIVLPLFGDQFDNAQRVTETGYGGRFEPYDFRDEDMVKKIQELLNDQEMKRRLEKAKQRIATSNSKEKAAKLAEEMLLNR